MNVSVEQRELQEALKVVDKVVPARRSVKPILHNCRLVAKNDSLEIIGTDLDVYVHKKISCAVVDEGELLVNCKQLFTLVKELKKNSVFDLVFGKKNGRKVLTVRAGEKSFDVFAEEDPKEYPSLVKVKGVALTVNEFKSVFDMLKMVQFAAAKEQARYAFNGILFHVKKEYLNVVATDGKRLAWAESEFGDLGRELSYIIPGSAVKILMSYEKSIDFDMPVVIKFSENMVWFKLDNISIYARLIEGQFPSYADVVPRGKGLHSTFETEELNVALKLASLACDTDSKAVTFMMERGNCALIGNSFSVGKSEIPAPMTFSGYKKSYASFNPTYVMEVLKMMKGVKQGVLTFGRKEIMTEDENGEEVGTGKYKIDSDVPGLFEFQLSFGKYSYIVMPIKTASPPPDDDDDDDPEIDEEVMEEEVAMKEEENAGTETVS